MGLSETDRERVFFSDAVCVGENSLVIAAGFSEAPDAVASRLYFKFGDRWGSSTVNNDFMVSVAYHNGILYGVGRNGVVKYVGSPGEEFSPKQVKGNINEFRIDEVAERGHLARVRCLGKEFIACGWGGQVYHLKSGKWDRTEIGIDQSRDNNILDIGGIYPNDVYAVGLNGLLLHYDGKTWTYLDSPTNNHFYSILYQSPKEIYLSGGNGGIYRGSREAWKFVGDREFSENLWSVALFKGELYVTYGDKGLATLAGDHLTNAEITLGYQPYTYRLTVGAGKLWSTGSHDLVSFDGESWQTISCPDNE